MGAAGRVVGADADADRPDRGDGDEEEVAEHLGHQLTGAATPHQPAPGEPEAELREGGQR